MPDTLLTQNPNHSGKTYPVDRAKYDSMRHAMLRVLPAEAPGIAVPALKDALLPDTLFTAGATAGWWLKCVQLDLEAKGSITRTPGSPVPLRRC